MRIAVIALIAALRTASVRPRLFPLQAGTTCTYSGVVQYTVINSAEVRSAHIEWTARVTKVWKKAHRTVAIIRGFPTDLAWYQPAHEPGYTVVVEDGEGVFVEKAAGEADAIETGKRAAAGEAVGRQWLRFPVKVGDCIPLDGTDLHNGMNCFRVVRELKDRRGRGWELMMRTLSDHEIITIVPGAGIVRYHYEHHGTVASADVRLIAVHPPPD